MLTGVCSELCELSIRAGRSFRIRVCSGFPGQHPRVVKDCLAEPVSVSRGGGSPCSYWSPWQLSLGEHGGSSLSLLLKGYRQVSALFVDLYLSPPSSSTPLSLHLILSAAPPTACSVHPALEPSVKAWTDPDWTAPSLVAPVFFVNVGMLRVNRGQQTFI